MTMVSKVDHKRSFNRLNSDPSLAIIPSGLKATNLVLEEESDGSWVSVPLEAQSEVGLRAFWVIIDHNFLVHVHAGLGQGLFFKAHCLRQDLKEFAGQAHEALAVLLCDFDPPLWLVWPS